jgi:hypothetical protein
MTIATFPQGKHKPSIQELLNSTLDLPIAAQRALWRRHYPELSREQIRTLYAENVERLRREADEDDRTLRFIIEAYREATGSPMARARARGMLAGFNSPKAQAFYRDLEAAVALDPFWEKLPKPGNYARRPGARHQTAEALVEAYRAAHPLKGRIAADFAKLMEGVDPEEAGAGDKAHAAMRALRRRYPEASANDFEREAMIRAWLDALVVDACERVWNEPAELTQHRVGGVQLPEIIDIPGTRSDRLDADGRKVLLEFATVGQWLAGPQPGGQEIGRILLERCGGDLTARILDHVDRETDQ